MRVTFDKAKGEPTIEQQRMLEMLTEHLDVTLDSEGVSDLAQRLIALDMITEDIEGVICMLKEASRGLEHVGILRNFLFERLYDSHSRFASVMSSLFNAEGYDRWADMNSRYSRREQQEESK